MKTLLTLSAAAAVAAMTATPAMAQHYARTHHVQKAKHHARWARGYHFGPRYAYTSYSRLPRTYVRQYNLSPRYRYVYNDGYIYQVDPTSYAVTRIIEALVR